MKQLLTTLFCCLISASASANSNWTPIKPFDLSELRLFLTATPRIDVNNPAAIGTDLIQQADEVCCPAGYPWYRQSANTCWSSQSDCQNTNGGGWYCRQVNSC